MITFKPNCKCITPDKICGKKKKAFGFIEQICVEAGGNLNSCEIAERSHTRPANPPPAGR